MMEKRRLNSNTGRGYNRKCFGNKPTRVYIGMEAMRNVSLNFTRFLRVKGF